MNSSINIASPNTVSANEASVSASTKTTQNGFNSAQSDDLAASAESFHDSIKKAYDDSRSTADAENTDNPEKDTDGNNLPLADNFPEIAAQDDRPNMPGGLYLSGELASSEVKQLPTQNGKADIDSETEIDAELALLSASAPVLTASDADKKTGADSKLSEIATQLRQLLNAETSANTKNSQAINNRTASGSTETSDNTVENTLIQQAENLALKTDLAGLNGDKTSVALNTSVQQATSNIQASLLLQATTAASDTGSDAMPVVSHTPANSTSPMTATSAMPQPAITEAFGRPAWSQAMGKQILLMVNQNISTAQIRLNPAHLGPIEMLINMSDEQVSVSMNSRHAIVREAMEQALPKLREMLEQNGFSLADADISKHSFAEQREQDNKGGNNGIAARNTEQSVSADSSHQVMKQATMSTSMVDYYI